MNIEKIKREVREEFLRLLDESDLIFKRKNIGQIYCNKVLDCADPETIKDLYGMIVFFKDPDCNGIAIFPKVGCKSLFNNLSHDIYYIFKGLSEGKGIRSLSLRSQGFKQFINEEARCTLTV